MTRNSVIVCVCKTAERQREWNCCNARVCRQLKRRGHDFPFFFTRHSEGRFRQSRYQCRAHAPSTFTMRNFFKLYVARVFCRVLSSGASTHARESSHRAYSFRPPTLCPHPVLSPPTKVMFDGTMRKKVADRVIDSYSIFKKGIKPEWEAPQNSQGGEWQSRSKMTPQALDLFWVSAARIP